MNRRQQTWNRLQDEMKAKRKRPDPRRKGKSKKSGSALHELIVQRLASEPTNKFLGQSNQESLWRFLARILR